MKTKSGNDPDESDVTIPQVNVLNTLSCALQIVTDPRRLQQLFGLSLVCAGPLMDLCL